MAPDKAGLRRWLQRLPGFDLDSTDLEGVNFWTLRFDEPLREGAYVGQNTDGLASGTYKNSFMMFLNIFLAWAVAGFDWSSSVFTFYASAYTHTVATARNVLLILTCVVALTCTLIAKVRRFRLIMGPPRFEMYVASQLFLVIVLVCLQSPWYLAVLFGLDAEVACTGAPTEDLYLLLSLDCIVTASHIAMPVRWFLLLPVELTVSLGYGAFAFLVSSNTLKMYK
mmetsp:Transcript_13264/g.42783  ORF Transcript_13264/g.42783 Transcript_13264/m.42783 type:complete len:225 (-) Transcript_13264:659-1333(-)